MPRSVAGRRASVVATVVAVGLVLVTVITPQGALAHERVTKGNYLFVIGWADEPALVGSKNSLDLRIFNNSTGTPVPVLNAENNLTAKFVYGSMTETVDLVPVFQQPGYYGADIIPTAAGIYSVNLTGRVGNQPVSFARALDGVEWPTSIEFPHPRPTTENLSNNVTSVSNRADGAQSMATIALALGAGGLILGAAGLGVALISRRRHREG